MRRPLLAALLVIQPAAAPAQQPAAAAPTAAPTMVRASMPFPANRDATLDFITDGPRALLLLTTGKTVAYHSVETVEDVLMLLGDARLAPLWPAIVAWAGRDLTALRDRRTRQAREALERGSPDFRVSMTAESVAQGRARAALQYAAALTESGRDAEAIAVLERERAATPRDAIDHIHERVLMGVRIAAIRRAADGAASAIEGLARDAAVPGDRPYAINLDINRAAFLAEAGRHAEALALIDATTVAFDDKRTRRDRIAGSKREFAWIRACALHGLGRTREAGKALVRLLHGGEPEDRQFIVKGTDSIRMRAAACMNDVEAGARVLAEAAKAAAGRIGAPAMLQPAFRGRNEKVAFVAALRAHPLVRAAWGARVHPLVPEMVAALNGWRTAT